MLLHNLSPMLPIATMGLMFARAWTSKPDSELSHEPPRCTFVRPELLPVGFVCACAEYRPNQSQHHSLTFPLISNKAKALAEVDGIAGDTAQAIVEQLLGGKVTKAEVTAAVRDVVK